MKAFLFVSLLCLLTFSCYAHGRTTTQQNIQEFTKWLDDNNVIRNFDLVDIPGQGLGGIATKSLTESDFLLKVPETKIVFLQDHTSINGWNNWSGTVGPEPLMIWILREKLNENSSWTPYLNLLPSNYDEHVLMWENEDFRFADKTGLVAYYQRTSMILKKSFEHLQNTLIEEQPDLFPVDYFNWDNYLWSYLVVSTRAWSIAERNGDMALVPLADMLNHVADAGRGGPGDGEFIINCTRSYTIGEQVYDSYGPKTNFELLTNYGFLPDTYNPYNGAVLELSLQMETNLVHQIAEPILSAAEPNYHQTTVRLNQIPLHLLRMFRLSALKFSELDMLDDIIRLKGVSLENERLAFHAAFEALQRVVEGYPTEEEENSLLARDDLNYKQKQTIHLRLGERQVFENVISSLKTLWGNILIEGQLIGGTPI